MKCCPRCLIAAVAAAALAGCATHSPTAACCVQSEATSGLTDKSIYQVDSSWTTDQNQPFKLSALAGRPQVLVMFFANCQYACPILVNDLKRIEAALPSDMRSQVGFTLVSFDPKRDTSAALANYRRNHKLSAGSWTLLHGQSDDVLELAALLGIKFKEDANGQFAHSNVITVLNSAGEIIHQEIGLNRDVADTVQAIEKWMPR
jgi:protein SCO1